MFEIKGDFQHVEVCTNPFGSLLLENLWVKNYSFWGVSEGQGAGGVVGATGEGYVEGL